MSTQLTLDDLRRALDAKDPELVPLLSQLVEQPDPVPDEPIPEKALTFDKFLNTVKSWQFRRKSEEEQEHERREMLKALEAPDLAPPLPPRLKSHEIIMELWKNNGLFARRCLLEIIATVPLRYGPWKAIKKIFKEAEAANDTEIYGALAARFDMVFSSYYSAREIGSGTLAYLVRRAWRYLRRLGQQLPAAYPDICVDFLIRYTDGTNWQGTWVANHIFYHGTRQYGFSRFHYWGQRSDLTKHRAYGELWQRTPRPLFSLLERAQSEQVWAFATAALKSDFRATLRELDAAYVIRLIGVHSQIIHEFVIWILDNVPRFEQAAFRNLGLHEPILKFFDSPSQKAREYAAEYARTHSRDLSVEELIRLANNDNAKVRQLANDLLTSRDPRKDIGLEAWGRLLETQYGYQLASKILTEHFGASELTPQWFKERLFTNNHQAFQFLKKLLPQIHAPKELGVEYFCDLINTIEDPDADGARQVSELALSQLPKFQLEGLPLPFLKRMLIHPLTAKRTIGWINEGKLRPQILTPEYLKTLTYHPDFESDPWLEELRNSGQKWTQTLTYNESLADQVLVWLRDVRNFSPNDLGFEWLMKLVRRTEPRYHGFAVDTMIKAFVPADFAPQEAVAETTASDVAVEVDLEGATFCFTGKLATMQRKEAEGKVKEARGVATSTVSSKLHYLVVGDEGSPLFGQGLKGSKQTKAEDINANKGGNIQIISETAFLKMLQGKRTEASSDATLAGCQRLFEMATAPGKDDAPTAQFARQYIRLHHPDISNEKTGKAPDPGAEIPQEFLSYERFESLLSETRKSLRDFTLDIARWEFARWAPSAESLVRLCESPHEDVRAFVMRSLLVEDDPEHKRYRIDPETLSPAAALSFCESPDDETRTLGMELIRRYPRFRVPEELFRLTESPDRKVRAFVIRSLWALYRDRGITRDWKPRPPVQTTVGKAARKAAVKEKERIGEGAPPRPETLPANELSLRDFLRRILFEIPPARLEGKAIAPREGIQVRLKPLPTRKAKLALIETIRDLALEDKEIARGVIPLFDEFMGSRGKSEHDACLVAITRIRHHHEEIVASA